MVHAQFLEAYIHFVLIYTSNNILSVLPIKDLINEDDEPTTQFKIGIVTETSILRLGVLFCPCHVQKATAHVGTMELKMHH